MERLLAIVRRPDRLAALIGIAKPFGAPAPGDRADSISASCDVAERPLGEMQPRQSWSGILGAWRRLERSAPTSADVLADVLEVLLETRCAEENRLSLPRFDVGPCDRPHATLAHPRAYCGTKYKPPRPRQPEPSDLRRYLCDRLGEVAVLRSLRHHLGDALEQLRDRGYEREQLARLERAIQRSCDVSVAYHNAAYVRVGELPRRFATHLLPALRGLEWKLVRRFLALYFDLNLEKDAALLRVVASLIAARACEGTLEWLRLLPAQPPARRRALAALILGTAVGERRPASGVPELLRELADAPDDQYPYLAHGALCALRRGSSAPYLREGVRLAKQTGQSPDLADAGDCPAFSFAVARPLLASLGCRDAWTVRLFWQSCGALPGLFDLVQHIDWRPFDSDHAGSLLALFMYARLFDPDGTEGWRVLRDHAHAIVDCLAAAPTAYRGKLLAFFNRCTDCWETAEELREHLADAIGFARRLGGPPFTIERIEPWAFVWLLDAEDRRLRNRLLGAPDACIRSLESACRSRNRALCVARGLETLVSELPSRTVEWFLEVPARLFRTARVLGSLDHEHRRQVVRRFGGSRILDPKLLSGSLSEVCGFLDEMSRSGGANPIPRALRDHLRGRTSLGPGQIERALRVVGEKLPLVELHALDREVLRALGGDRLGAPISPPSDDVIHALEMVGQAEENRRTFRRFLHAWWRGDVDWLLRHPENRNWLSRHPRVNAAMWTRGIQQVVEVDGVTLDLRVETRPLEALRLGSMVGSCLAIGGGFAHSAVATVLDINKQVIYARDGRGIVRGRQVVAISERDELVCFPIYPVGASAAIKDAFRVYDEAFALALGVPLFRQGPKAERYEIALTLAGSWYDDGPWDLRSDRETS